MSPRIAVIDDEPIILDLLYELLSEEGYTPHVFADGNRAWPHLRARAPHAIILDLRVGPRGGDGQDVLARLRHDPVLHATPVILCSADLPARPAHGNAVLAPGCALLPKPFDLNDLLTVLRALTGGPS